MNERPISTRTEALLLRFSGFLGHSVIGIAPCDSPSATDGWTVRIECDDVDHARKEVGPEGRVYRRTGKPAPNKWELVPAPGRKGGGR